MTSDAPTSVDERKATKKPLVLVVDDDPTHHKLLELLAEPLEITIQMAISCTEAMEAVGMFECDIILMDIRMPHIDGHLCTRWIRALRGSKRDIPIIAITANDSEDNRQKCMEAGMNDFLRKPFTLEELNAKISAWLYKKAE
jgi:CheY-like chemotaxis protein